MRFFPGRVLGLGELHFILLFSTIRLFHHSFLGRLGGAAAFSTFLHHGLFHVIWI
jgi:hypothetical protein